MFYFFNKNILHKLLPQIALACFLFIGIIVYDDYGVAWDENMQINDNGEATFNFIGNRDTATYLQNPEKYHGPAFELLLTSFQKIGGLTDTRQIYLFRHLITFIFYWLSGVAFYFILRKKITDRFVIFIGICWYFLMPRIFADSFYNTKDVALLSMNMICILSMINFLERPTWKQGVLHGFFCGFMIAIRILGVLIPIVTLVLVFVRVFFDKNGVKVKTSIFYLKFFLVFISSTILFTIAFWPVLWIDPVFYFVSAWKAMSHNPWISGVLYWGEYIYTNALPWHYNFIWILITTPLQYILFFIIGFSITIIHILSLKKNRILNFELEFASALLLFAPLISVIVFHSVVYDGWRHVFFIYAPFSILAVKGLLEIKIFFNRFFRPVWFYMIIILITLPIAFKMVKMHPYQNIYFNRIVGPNAGSAKFNYEMDYWGLAYREALEKLNSKTGDKEISVFVPNPSGMYNSGILPKSIRNKFIFKNLDEANYFITDYRWSRIEFNELKRIDSIKVDGAVISSTYLLKTEEKKTIHLKAANDKFLSVHRKLNNTVIANKEEPNLAETFTLIMLEDNNCAILSHDEYYLCAELESKNEITATREQKGQWETFTLLELDSNYFAFKAYNDKYLSIDEKSLQLFAKADSIGKNEKFKIIPGCFGCEILSKGYIYSAP